MKATITFKSGETQELDGVTTVEPVGNGMLVLPIKADDYSNDKPKFGQYWFLRADSLVSVVLVRQESDDEDEKYAWHKKEGDDEA
jgi:hypothetical protein